MIRMTRDLNIKSAAPGLQAYLISLPFHFPEEALNRVYKLLEPLVRRPSRCDVIRIQATGETVDAVLQDLAHAISVMDCPRFLPTSSDTQT